MDHRRTKKQTRVHPSLSLRAHPQLKDTAAIVCASRPDRRDFRGAIEAGADGFMMRTFDAAVLIAAVHTVLAD